MSEKLRRARERIDRTFRGQLTAAGALRATYEAEIQAGTPLEKVTSPDFWFSQVSRLKPLDRIECTWDDGSLIAMLRVMGIDERAGMVLVAVVSTDEFDAPALPPGYDYEFVNKGLGWRILREGQKQPLRSGFATKLDAYAWLSGERSDVDKGDAGDALNEKGKGASGKSGGVGTTKKVPPAPPAAGAEAQQAT